MAEALAVEQTMDQKWSSADAGGIDARHFDTVLESLPIGIVFLNGSTVIQANSFAANLYGYTLDEFVGMKMWEVYPSRDAYRELVGKCLPVMLGGDIYRSTINYATRDGRSLWVHTAGRLIDKGESRLSLWIVEDISVEYRMNDALERSMRELTTIFNNASVGIAVLNGVTVTRCNRRLEEILGVAPGDLLGRTSESLYTNKAEADAFVEDSMVDLSMNGMHRRELNYHHPDGNPRRLSMVATRMEQRDEEVDGASVWLIDDVTAEREAEERARQAYDLQQTMFDNAAVGIMYTRKRSIVRCNRRLAELFGYEVEDLVGRMTRVLYYDDADYEAAGKIAYGTDANNMTSMIESRFMHKDGHELWMRLNGSHLTADRSEAVWIWQDISEHRKAQQALAEIHHDLEMRVQTRTAELAAANNRLKAEALERQQANEKIWHVAHHDILTGLPNRALLDDRLAQALRHAKRKKRKAAVLFLDLDRFKSINDSLGHALGDELLKQVAARLTNAVRAVDTVSRLGGDEFVVLLHDLDSGDRAMHVTEKIFSSLQAPFLIGHHELRATPSIGISLFPDDGEYADVLMKNADAAMYHAKAMGRNTFQFFAPQMNERAERLFHLEHRLRRAIDEGQLVLHYQPQVNLETGQVCGMEALVRWHDPERGTISPAEFIPLAEEIGLIIPLGKWVMNEALRQNRAWQDAGFPALPMSINLSPRQFRESNLTEQVSELLKRHGQPPALLELEITESSLMDDVERARATLEELAAMGVSLAIDDFGTGYSSLNYLKRLPLSKLKIDQSFVRDLATDADDSAIVNAIVGLSRSLGLSTVAEGVESEDQLAALRRLGCTKIQGYYFSRPLMPTLATEIFHPKRLDD